MYQSMKNMRGIVTGATLAASVAMAGCTTIEEGLGLEPNPDPNAARERYCSQSPARAVFNELAIGVILDVITGDFDRSSLPTWAGGVSRQEMQRYRRLCTNYTATQQPVEENPFALANQ